MSSTLSISVSNELGNAQQEVRVKAKIIAKEKVLWGLKF